MDTKKLPIRTSIPSISDKLSFDGYYETPATIEGKVELYGAAVVNMLVETRIKQALGHKVNQLLMKGDLDNENIQEMINGWKPSLRVMGRVTERMVRDEKDPTRRKELLIRMQQQMRELEESISQISDDPNEEYGDDEYGCDADGNHIFRVKNDKED